MKDVEQAILTYLTERGWDKLRPSDISKSISIEAAELLELFQWTNQSLEEVKQNAEQLEKIKKELADVLIYALDMSVLLGFDTKQIILDKLAYVQKKFPADLMKQRAKEGSGSGEDEVYLTIKKQYRQSGQS